MKQFTKAILFLTVISLWSCNQSETTTNKKITKQDSLHPIDTMKLKSDKMTPEVLWSFGRVNGVTVSPAKNQLLFGVKYYDIAENKGNNDLYIMDDNGNFFKQITHTPFSEFNFMWRPDGKKIGFLSSETGTVQLWEMNLDGTGRKQISNIEGGITGFKYSPTLNKILYTKEVKLDTTARDLYPDLPKSTGRIITDLMYRHWDTWCDTYSHVFVADYVLGDTVKNSVDLMPNEKYNTPLKPFGGMEQINWTPDGKKVAYTCVKKYGKAYTLSTNSDIYLYDVASKTTTNLTEGMMGYDVAPVFSENGKYMAWESMEHDGYESDKNRLFIMDLTTGEKKDYTTNFDQNVHNLVWKGNTLVYFISEWHGVKDIYELSTTRDTIRRITDGVHNYNSIELTEKGLVGMRQSMSMPTEIYAVNTNTGEETQLSHINKPLLKQLTMGKVEARWIKTFDKKDMLVWVIYPPHFDSTKQYPALLYCQGGPQSMVSQFWSYRWNFQMMAANDYIIVAPNRRGLPGFGTKWNEQISKDYGGANMKDYLTAIDELSKEPYIDANRLGAVGASYGGFSVYWLAGNHNNRFKAFIAHDGIFDLEAQYYETDEMWFVNWDLGGPPWDKSNKVAQKSYATSPNKFVDKWNTPILVIHGGHDYRIADTQGMMAFDAAILRNVPAEFLYFPDESHWVLKPQNGILWQRTFFSWLDKWLK
jgi:dipeptidyl aminopeptidase/acylaminoacyl peptidase